MPETITLSHVLLLLAALAMVYCLVQFGASRRYSGPQHGHGTPGYARARDSKRYTLWSAAAVVFLCALALLTPLGRVALL